MNSKLKPALLGGLIMGVLSAIPIIYYCCCIWSIGGGALAAYLYIKSSPTPVKMGDGAMVGGFAGGVGALIYLVLGLPILILLGTYSEYQLAQSGVTLPFSGVWLNIVQGTVSAVLLAVLATVGGIIGVAIFEKRKGDGLAPPEPQDFGGGPGSYGSGM